MPKFKNEKQVIDALKSACDKENKALMDARAVYRRHGGHLPYKELKYRTFAGPFKVKDCVFESKRFYFSPLALEATSYDWWHMLLVRNGKLIRNTCDYSMQTAKHQTTLDRALKALGIKPDLEVHTKANIGRPDVWMHQELKEYAERYIAWKYSRAKGKPWRYKWLKRKERELARLEKAKIGLKFTAKAKALYIKNAEERRVERNKHLQMTRRMSQPIEKQVVNARTAPMVNNEIQIARLTLVKG